MALIVADRVQETTTTTGTGTYTLAGAKDGFQSFATIGDGNTTYYACTDGTDYEVGIGTYTASGTTLARTTIIESSNDSPSANAAVDWGSGSKDIFVTLPASKAVVLDASDDLTLTGDSYNAVWDKSANALRFDEGAQLWLGATGRTRFYHTGSSGDGYIDTYTGSTYISAFADNEDIIIRTDDGIGGLANYFVADGSTGQANLYHYGTEMLSTRSYGGFLSGGTWYLGSNLGLNTFKVSERLDIKHGGASGNGEILNTQGNLTIINSANDKDVNIQTDNGSGSYTTYFKADGSTGETLLYHYGATKLATKTGGINVTGTVTDDGATHDGDVTFTGATVDITFDQSANAIRFDDGARAYFGSSSDLTIYHEGVTTESRIWNASGDLNIKNLATDKDVVIETDNGFGQIEPAIIARGTDGKVLLHCNGNEVFSTTGGGITVTGYVYVKTPGYIIFEGSTADIYETNLYATDPTQDNAIYLPDESGTIATRSRAFGMALLFGG